MGDEPWKELFSVTRGRRSGEVLSANDLSDVDIDGVSKTWACQGLSHILDHDEQWISFGLPGNDRDLVAFCALFSLPVKTVQGWMQRFKKGQPLSDSLGGAPQLIDTEGKLRLKERILGARPRPTTKVFVSWLIEAAKETAERRGKTKAQQARITSVSKSSLAHYTHYLELTKRTGQPVFPERARAVADTRLVCKWIIVLLATFGVLPGYKKWNSDPSMVGIEPSNAGMKVWVAKEEEANAHERLVIENPSVRPRVVCLVGHLLWFILL